MSSQFSRKMTISTDPGFFTGDGTPVNQRTGRKHTYLPGERSRSAWAGAEHGGERGAAVRRSPLNASSSSPPIPFALHAAPSYALAPPPGAALSSAHPPPALSPSAGGGGAHRSSSCRSATLRERMPPPTGVVRGPLMPTCGRSRTDGLRTDWLGLAARRAVRGEGAATAEWAVRRRAVRPLPQTAWQLR